MMYGPLRNYFNFYNKSKKNKFYTDEEIRNTMVDTLGNLFNDNRKLITLSKTFQIFPSFFTQKILQEMLASHQIATYLHYIQKHVNQRIFIKLDTPLKHTLEKMDLYHSIDYRILQCYIHYLRTYQDLTESDDIMETLDLRNPQNWFGLTRLYERKFIYHHGPTNSGKTFSAINELKSLNQNQKGIYMAPLRLLAWETQQKLGKCNLITGQQKDYQNSHLTSCTIEACTLDEDYEVAIIDEIQMIEDRERGWSWTNKILGLRAKKIHLCGDQRAINLISELISKSGGQLEEVRYNRLSKLHLIGRNFNANRLLPGDCMIDFSSAKLYGHRKKINKKIHLQSSQDSVNNHIQNKTAIIYGKMPPSCRKRQAQLFNKGELPYLVASNAIGMGLNLMIRRIIFTNLQKMSSEGFEKMLEDHEIRQIAGRAGRGRDFGYVICSNFEIRSRVKNALNNVNITLDQKDPGLDEDITYSGVNTSIDIKAEPINSGKFDKKLNRYLNKDEMKIKSAGLFFPFTIILRIKIKIEGMLNKKLKLGDAIRLICSLSRTSRQLYFIQDTNRLVKFCDRLQNLKLSIIYQFLFASMPINTSISGKILNSIMKYAQQFQAVGVVQIPSDILEKYETNFSQFETVKGIKALEKYYIRLEAYTWLWDHFELYFPYGVLAQKIKQSVCWKIDEILNQETKEFQVQQEKQQSQ